MDEAEKHKNHDQHKTPSEPSMGLAPNPLISEFLLLLYYLINAVPPINMKIIVMVFSFNSFKVCSHWISDGVP